MNNIDLTYFKQLLVNELNRLRSLEQATIHDISSRENEGTDLCDMASNETDRNYYLRIRGRENRLIKKIEDALERIEDGSFGTCISCGEEIPLSRLKARPVAMYCIECKEKSERFEKAAGL